MGEKAKHEILSLISNKKMKLNLEEDSKKILLFRKEFQNFF